MNALIEFQGARSNFETLGERVASRFEGDTVTADGGDPEEAGDQEAAGDPEGNPFGLFQVDEKAA